MAGDDQRTPVTPCRRDRGEGPHRMDAALSLRTAPRFIIAGIARYLIAILRELPLAVGRQKLVLGIIAVYWIGGIIVGRIAGVPPAATISGYLPSYIIITPTMIAALLIGRGLIIMVRERPKRPLTQLAHEFRTSLASPRRVAHALPMLLSMMVLGGTFTVVKASIPSLMPFSWDAAFESWDRTLHGGIAPWEWLQPMLGMPIITTGINVAYNFWFFFLALVWVWQAFSQRDEQLRLQFFLTLTIGWILLGNVMATLLSSAGPCYFGLVTGLPDPFVPLMNYLHAANESHAVWAVTTQDLLWRNYLSHENMLGAGISAMPSMHIAMATLFALVTWRANRYAGIAMTIFAVVIMIGSVHLAWHYAIDGYVGALGICAIWWAVGRMLAQRNARARVATVG
jgi:hypothetical protein